MLEHSVPSALAAAITWHASRQTYWTIRWLVDRDRVAHAFCAYAYFRWVDDYLDRPACPSAERQAFLQRQRDIITACRESYILNPVAPEEALLVALIQSEPNPESGLHLYIQHMMSVMEFDAERRGRMISQAELERYTHGLAVAVTEALHYFIGHQCPPPCNELRYCAASAAHIVHMLRDTYEDTALEYYNVPREVVEAGGITPQDIHSAPYREWVRSRVKQAREDFRHGLAYLAQVQNRRCRLAGYAYIIRFENVLHTIEHENYLLRPAYPERKRLLHGSGMLISALWHTLLPAQAVLYASKGS
ncbi:MAG: squalene/phytoene synthase family protein [Thermanaerothrix sp.]|nr:squalene/phytoene synthase family protein [Thermanaerothrix sp.]